MEIIEEALAKGQKILSEHESKLLLTAAGVPVTKEILATSLEEAVKSAEKIGYPIVLKGSAPELAHKTEFNLVKLHLKNSAEVTEAYIKIMEGMSNYRKGVLVQEMVTGIRELVVGLVRDSCFGPCVMFGLGGIMTEILRDVSFRVAPLTLQDALDMQDEIRGRKILDTFRGQKAADREALARILISVGEIGLNDQRIKEIDINPLIITNEGELVAADALIVLQ